ncbi:nucleotide sugar dehydrogenase (plasmid) [Haloferax mediterranei ATCC 33500]|uniref:UDP-N-acetyl-D-mannosamine dehydrogenase n=1 Tax=Haloferax mediterranei (strain ATCC 33500 / DSM 1411 / JCM 8866 / NBRC 14739 / NCIMB 2177 / R-4) TaxID=523841 RepID=I3RAJ9_HALMT|nr:nucleotide sugar dehydrogenase [Haloferax mediterranei]AFK21259.1 nucleotide sugar dehydrogenase / UDP-N-acetyl-D-galactosamine 6-dehydrogenase [Haloferax mediterranei ATCC 33500]AHZ24643.1 nucleotide sugar dehydrogenase [Haloferax mediterranei ATCC 33500]ELZ97410.1 nucleotide sugar dehydrogenase / UDP-N-acetyl-D-galactosamine 6-dehydrogenase [Haloferax mediterranei ATCC 33500]MDX5990294.1 nucleotide sugar dehydrogenase [Haloferax mediterranei ATCC 33500]QCQ77038.1 nucleotide sugar dehydrog
MSSQATVTNLYGSERPEDEQVAALTSGHIPVGVYGLGKMGLPLAAVYAETTENVTGADIDTNVVNEINAGRSHIVGEPGLDDLVSELVADGALQASPEPREVADEVSIHVVIVPTLVDEDDRPDLSVIEAVTNDIGMGLDEGDLVIFESTLPPRSCRDVLLPRLEEQSGLSLGEFGLAFCPERTSSGRALEDIRGAYPKVVGGADAESTRAAALIYDQISSNEVITVSDTTTAEAVKVFEGVYRDVNIALANELATHADEFEIDVTEAIDVANTQPFCEIHTPGAGVGGHCIPYYPQFLIKQFETDAPLMRTARDVNDEMPHVTAQSALDELRKLDVDPEDASILVLGLTYRAGVKEIRKTPALPVIEHLVDAGADVTATDPILDDTSVFEDAGATITPGITSDDFSVDAVVLVTAHEEFEHLDIPAFGDADGDSDSDGDGDSDCPLVLVDGRQAATAYRDDESVVYQGIGLHD